MVRIFLISLVTAAVLALSLAANKPLPVIQDKAFTAKFQIIIANKAGENFFAIERYDETQQSSSLETIMGDQSNLLIMDYKDQTVKDIVYSISTKKASKCNIISMNQALSNPSLGLSDDFHFFGGWRDTSSKTIPHMFSTKSIFTLNTTKPFTYQGTATIDGITADQWSAPFVWTDDKDTFKVDYFFTSTAWSSAETRDFTKVYPLRIEITGTKQTDTGPQDIHHYYEYLDFVGSDRLASDAFDIPWGANCAPLGTVPTRPVPRIPATISYKREVVDGNGNVDFARITYDRKIGLMMVESGNRNVLYDFNSGVRYESKDVACETRAIDPEKDSNSQMVGYFVQDIGPAEFWLLNKTFPYLGQGHSRQIGASIYGQPIDSQPFDVYFGNLDWNFSPSYSTPPLTMDRDGKHYNFFDFRENSWSLSMSYMWGACRSVTRRKTIKVIFYADRYASKDQIFTDKSIAKMSDIITKQSWLSASQVQVLKDSSFYDGESQRLTLYVRLFGPPSAQYMYRRGKNFKLDVKNAKSMTKSLTASDQDSAIAKSADLCEATASSSTFLCRNYDLCKNTDGSYTVTMYAGVPSGASIAQSLTCDHFARSVDTNTPISLDDAMSNLQDAVTKGFLNVVIQGRWLPQQLRGVAIESISYRSIKTDPASPRSKFRVVYNRSFTNKLVTVSTKSSEDCASLCLARDAYKCRAYKYCYNVKSCALSSGYPHRNSSAVADRCRTYRRMFVSEFTKMPGLTMPYATKTAYKNVHGSNSCATKCMQNEDFKCESFDYCHDSRECLLSKTHVYSVPEDQVKNITPSCSHYSKNYLLDFDIATNTALSSDDKQGLQTIVTASPDKCAYLCRTSYGGKCVQFDYCSDEKMCQIATIKSKSYVAHVPRQNCDTYTLSDAQKVVASGKLTSNGTTYSDGAYGGLAVAMIVIGLAIGAVILLVLHRRGTLSKLTG